MATAKKIGNRVGVGDWKALATVSDVKRFLRWVILSMRDTTLEPNQASIFAQIGGVMLKTLQASEFEKRLEDIEQRLATPERHDESGSPTAMH
jgi:hypothetical protein